jgi:hypothetical protein
MAHYNKFIAAKPEILKLPRPHKDKKSCPSSVLLFCLRIAPQSAFNLKLMQNQKGNLSLSPLEDDE